MILVKLDEILRAIPHRPPFLFVDEVVELSDTRIIARKWLDPSLPFFQGHFPSFPIMPGVLTCEAVFQTGALLLSEIMREENERCGFSGDGCSPFTGKVPVVTAVREVRLKRMILPGSTLEMSVELLERVSNAFLMKGKAFVGGKVAVRLEFTCTTVDISSLGEGKEHI